MMDWSIQDVDDELLAASDLIKIGDAIADGGSFHTRARRHIARAQMMSSALLQCVMDVASAAQVSASSQASGTDESSGLETIPDAESVTAKPPAFVGGDGKLLRALGGPYKDQTLVIYPGRTRWVVRDAGGSRSSVHATSDTGPIDAIPSHLFPGLTVEGYYRAEQTDGWAVWTPVAGMMDRPSPKLA